MKAYDSKKLLGSFGYLGVVSGMAAWVLFVVPPDLGSIIFSGPLGLVTIGYSILLLQKAVVKTDQTIQIIRVHHGTTLREYLLERLTR